ncbi:MAG: hypothetical protein KGZ50_01535 [Peptococcaceae bacterium]|nr:hypothetical protein [Peptococcaceae bacterium]
MNKKDLGNHLLAVVLAFVFWFYVQSTLVPLPQADVPVQRFAAVALEMRNRPAELDLQNEVVGAVALTVRASREVLAELAASDLVAYLDLRGLRAGSNTLAVRVDVPAGIEVVAVSPARVEVVLEPVTAVNLPVTLLQRGRPAEGYFAPPGAVAPLTVTAVGGQSAVILVVPPVLEIDVAGRNTEIVGTRELIPVDSSARPVSKVTLNPATVQFIQPIFPIKTLSLRAVTKGQLAPGVKSVRLEIIVPEVRLAASPALLERLQELPLEVSIEGLTKEQIVEVAVVVPPGTFLVSAPTVSVRVLVTLGP